MWFLLRLCVYWLVGYLVVSAGYPWWAGVVSAVLLSMCYTTARDAYNEKRPG